MKKFKKIIFIFINLFSIKILCIQNIDEQKFIQNLNEWSRPMLETFQLVNSKSYYPIKVEDAMVRALDAFVQRDKYSRFLSSKDYQDLIKTTQGEFFGIGIILGPKKQEDDFLLILDVIPDSPAYKSGLKQYDKIVSIENEAVSNLSVEEAINKLKGEKRFSKVKVDVLRDQKLNSFTIERDIIKEEHCTCYYFKEQKIIYCSIALFTNQVANQLRTIMKKISNMNPKGIIIDLRNNAGGVLGAAVDCASIFLKKKSIIVSTKDRNQKIQEQLYTQKDPILNKKIPIIILINNFTASAAEILAGVLKIHSSLANSNNSSGTVNPYIFLLGCNTYGKGSVQEVIPVSNNCALKITTCIYYLPNNKSIDHIGIEPDFYVEQKYPPSNEIKLINKLYGKENIKNNNLESEKEINKNWKIKKIESLKNDFQIISAVNIISFLNFAIQNNNKNVNTHSKALEFLKQIFVTENQITVEEIK